MPRLKRLLVVLLSISILLTQGFPFPYLAYAMDVASQVPINGNVTIDWTTADQVMLGSEFNPYDGLEVIDADGDNVALLTRVEGDVDINQIGTYPINYSISNVDGDTFIEAETESPIVWPPDVKSQLIGKDPDAEKD